MRLTIICFVLLTFLLMAPVMAANPDVNNDGTIDVRDLLQVAQSLSLQYDSKFDIDGSGALDVRDLLSLVKNLGRSSNTISLSFYLTTSAEGNHFSLPFAIQATNITSQCPGTLEGHTAANGYAQTNQIQLGHGYRFHTTQPCTLTIAKSAQDPFEQGVPLSLGWNLVGASDSPIQIQTIINDCQIIDLQQWRVTAQSEGWIVPTVLESYTAIAVNVATPCTMKYSQAPFLLLSADLDGDGTKEKIELRADGTVLVDTTSTSLKAFNQSQIRTDTLTDVLVGDFDGDGKDELMGWQNDKFYLFGTTSLTLERSDTFHTCSMQTIAPSALMVGNCDADAADEMILQTAGKRICWGTSGIPQVDEICSPLNAQMGLMPASVVEGQGYNFQYAKDINAKTTHLYVDPRVVSQAKDVNDWTRSSTQNPDSLDANVLGAQSAGLTILDISLWDLMPSWVQCQNPSCDAVVNAGTSGCLPIQQDRIDYRTFVKALIERYDGDGINDMPNLKQGIQGFRIGHETSARNWCGTADEYATNFEDIRTAVLANNPKMTIYFGAPQGDLLACVVQASACTPNGYMRQNEQTSIDLLDQIYRKVDHTKIDAYALDPYQSDWQSVPELYDNFISYLTQLRGTTPKLMVVEDGEALEYERIFPYTDARQSEQIVKRMMIAFARNISAVNWFGLYWHHNCAPIDCSCANQIPSSGSCSQVDEYGNCFCYGTVIGTGQYTKCIGTADIPGGCALHHCRTETITTVQGTQPYQCTDNTNTIYRGVRDGDYENMNLLEYQELTAPWGYDKRPGYYTFKLLAQKLNGASGVETLSEQRNGYYAYRVAVKQKSVYILWSETPATFTLPIDSQATITNIITQRGQQLPITKTITPTNGLVTLNLNTTPIILEPN